MHKRHNYIYIFIQIYLFVYIFAIYVLCVCMYVLAHTTVEIKEQHVEIGFLFPLCRSFSITGRSTSEMLFCWVKEAFEKGKSINQCL